MGGMSTNHGLGSADPGDPVRTPFFRGVGTMPGDANGLRVFGTLLGPETTGPLPLPGVVGVVVFCFGSRAWPKPRTSTSLSGVVCGGGCDGVVVWELHSGREHLARTTRICSACPLGGWHFLCVVFAKAII